jgi:hypothetical protein
VENFVGILILLLLSVGSIKANFEDVAQFVFSSIHQHCQDQQINFVLKYFLWQACDSEPIFVLSVPG